MRILFFGLLLSGIATLLSCHLTVESDCPIAVPALRVEGMSGWVVTDEPTPRLSWPPAEHLAEKTVSGYEVLIADSRNDIDNTNATLWQSDLLPVEDGPWMLFDASELPSRTQVWWRVRTAYTDGSRSEWSDPAVFETGLKHAGDWLGEWIGMDAVYRERSAPQFRTTFDIDKQVQKARLYVAALGWHESHLNGSKLGDAVMDPVQTDYDQRLFYVTHDVTALLHQGNNVLAFWVGDGFFNQDRVWGHAGASYGQPAIKVQLEVTFGDGTTKTVSTDQSWQCKASPILASNVYAGETYDARLYDKHWNKATPDASGWMPVIVMPEPGGVMEAQSLPPNRRKETINPIAVSRLKENTWVYDFGVNLVGWAKLHVDATPGTKLTIRFAEDLLPNGELNFATGGVFATGVIQTDIYICKGEGPESWEPRFTYHGFRYAELTVEDGHLVAGEPGLELFEGIVIHTDMKPMGTFHCSDETLNKAFEMGYRTLVGNVLGLPTDCPIRERCGWTGDAHLIVPYSMYLFDAATMWRKYTTDIVTTAQRSGNMLVFKPHERSVGYKERGIPTMVAPGKRFIGGASPEWGSALVYIPWDLYLLTGDTRSLIQHYSYMSQWTNHLQGLATNDIIYSGMGDWCKPWHGDVDRNEDRRFYAEVVPMLSTACFYRCASIMAETARLLGKEEDAAHFANMATRVREAFTKAFYGDNPIMTPDQTINAIAIDWGVLAPEHHEMAAKMLDQQVRDAGYHFLTGVFGMPSLWPSLANFGYSETLWKALQAEKSPSLKYLMQRNATTFWEVWPTEEDEDEVYTRSMSHPFQAGFIAWFFQGLAGIKPDSDHPGFRHIHLDPHIAEGLTHVHCRYNSAMGIIESSWEKEGSSLSWYIEIPAGATAHANIPGTLVSITDSKGNNIEAGQKKHAQHKKREVVVLKAGRYHIKSIL